MTKILHFGKIDFCHSGKKRNAVEIRVEWDGKVLSVSGDVWNNTHTDIVSGGQCQDGLLPFFEHNHRFLEIYELWNKYHLNDLRPGTHKQCKLLEENGIKEYDECCKFLKEKGLFIDKMDSKTEWIEHKNPEFNADKVTYGYGWMDWVIPDEDVKKIEEIMK